MDANEIIKIKKEYNEGKITFTQASLALIIEGCKSEEVITLIGSPR